MYVLVAARLRGRATDVDFRCDWIVFGNSALWDYDLRRT